MWSAFHDDLTSEPILLESLSYWEKINVLYFLRFSRNTSRNQDKREEKEPRLLLYIYIYIYLSLMLTIRSIKGVLKRVSWQSLIFPLVTWICFIALLTMSFPLPIHVSVVSLVVRARSFRQSLHRKRGLIRSFILREDSFLVHYTGPRFMYFRG